MTNSKDGVFTRCTEFNERQNGLQVRESAQEACLGDILKVHDFNYIQKAMEKIAHLEGTKNKVIVAFDGLDTAASELTWKAALLAAGAVIEACD